MADVWVAGNVTDLAAQVGAAASSGAAAAAQINADLVAEQTRRDTDPHGHEITIRDAVLKARKRP